MNLKSKVFGIVGAALISLSMVGAVGAQTADVTVKVGAPDNAVLSASITAGTFQEVKYRPGSSFQNSDGQVTVTATDTRGVGSGWTVTIAAKGDFQDTTDSSRTFSVSNFSLQSGSMQGLSSASVNGITPAAVSAVSTSNQAIMTTKKGSGMGSFTDTINATIKVPDGTLVGSYKTTLTVTITASN
jgi:hypothetical protein